MGDIIRVSNLFAQGKHRGNLSGIESQMGYEHETQGNQRCALAVSRFILVILRDRASHAEGSRARKRTGNHGYRCG